MRGIAHCSTRHTRGGRALVAEWKAFPPPRCQRKPKAGKPGLEVTTYRFQFARFQTSPIIIPFGEIHRFFVNQSGLGLNSSLKYKPDEWINKVNLSQLTKAKTSKKISPERAREILDTVISELLPNNLQRQNQILRIIFIIIISNEY